MTIARQRAHALTTQILVGRGIRVTQQGSSAYVCADARTLEPTSINLPYLPDDAGEALVDAVQGYIDHEAGHVLFTDWSVCADAARHGLASSHNIVEDVYVERSMEETFPGSAENLDKLRRFFASEITPGLLRDAGENRVQAFEALVVPAVRALAGQRQFVDFMDGGRYWERPALKRFQEFFGETGRDRLPGLTSSADCLDVARLLDRAVRAVIAAPEPASLPTNAGHGVGASLESAPDGHAAGSGQSSARLDTTDDLDACARESPGGEPVQPSLGSGLTDRGGAAPVDGLRDETPPIPSGEADGATSREAQAEISEGPSGAAVAPSGASASDPFSSAVGRAISERAEAATARAAYRIWTRDHDVIAPLAICNGYDDQWLVDLDDTVAETTGVLQRQFERAMATRTAVRMTAGFRSGRLHTGSLHRIATGDDRIFRRRQEAVATDAAISLLIDNSRSMGGNKLSLAMMAGYALSQTAERVRIPCECLGFTTGLPSNDAPWSERESTGGIPYSRWIPLYLPIYKGFDERFGPLVRTRFAAASKRQWFCRANVDGESVAIVARRLLARRERRRVLIVISDGEPSGGLVEDLVAHLHATVEAVTKSGIELIGIGIGSAAVRKFYPRSIVLRSFDELPSAVVRELSWLAGPDRSALPPRATPASKAGSKRRRGDGQG